MQAETEDLFERLFVIHHRVVTSMHSVAGFEEWSALEILVLRVFVRSKTALSTADVARALGISVPHASRIAKRLKENGLLTEFRWRQTRALSLTPAGREWLGREMHNLTAFTDEIFARLTPAERLALDALLERITSSVF